MNLANLAISITAVDATHGLFTRMSKNCQKFKDDLKELWRQGEKVNATMKVLGKAGTYSAMTFGGIAAATGAHQIINGLADAQEGFNKIAVLSGKSTEQMEAFKRKIYEIATKTATGPEQILNAAINKIGEGMSDADIFSTLEKEGLYFKATFSKNFTEISDATLKISRNMKMDLDTVTDSFAGLHEIMKGSGKLDFESFMKSSEGLTRDAGLIMGSKSGKGKEGILQLAVATKFASKTMSADEATSGAEAFFSDLVKSKTEGTLQKVAGIDLDMLRKGAEKSGNAIGYIIDRITQATRGDDLALSQLFKSDSTRKFIKSIQDNKAEFEKTWRSVENANHSQAFKDQEQAMKSIKEQWSLFRIQLTQAMDKNVAPWLDKITNALKWLNSDAKGANATMIALKATFGVAFLAKGTNMLVSFGKGVKDAAGSAKGLYDGLNKYYEKLKIQQAYSKAGVQVPNNATGILSKITTGLGKAATASWGFVKSLWAQAAAWAATPMGMITIAIAAIVVGAILIYKNWDKVKAFFVKTWEWFKGIWAMVPGWMQWLFPLVKIPTVIVQNWGKISGFFKGLWGGIKSVFSTAWNWISGTVGKIFNIYATVGRGIWSVFSKVFGFIGGIFKKFYNAGANIVSSIWNGMKSLINKPVEAIKGMAEKIRKFLPFSPAKEGPLRDIHKLKFAETIASSINDAPLVNRMKNMAGKAFGQLKTLTPALSLAAAPMAGARGVQQPIKITINIDARGAAPGVEQNIQKAVMQCIPQIEKALAASQERRARSSNSGR